MNILAIETSCDETATAVVEDGTKIISNVVASSTQMHEKYGGIVPEVAARKQLESIIPVIAEALTPLVKNGLSKQALQGQPLQMALQQSIDAIAVTVGPGLIGSLLVGVETVKTIAFVTGKPIIPVNHVIAHMYANFIKNDKREVISEKKNKIQFPAISLVTSGGHTELYLMTSVKDLQWLGGTLDDAAGECFDKTARILGFGNGGGAAIQEAAKECKMPFGKTQDRQSAKCKIILPRPMIQDEGLNFSFSGLKTAVMREWKKHEFHKATPCGVGFARGGFDKTELTNAFAFEIQEAITDVLVKKTIRAARKYQAKSILLSGGVSSNLRLREKFSILHSPFSIHVPPAQLCTDNAVMIGSCAFFRGKPEDWHSITALPDLSVE